MFTTNLMEFKIQQTELIRRAAHYRLVKSLDKPSRYLARFYTMIGRMLIQSGHQLIKRTQAAH